MMMKATTSETETRTIKLNTYYIMKDIKAYLIGAAVGVTVYIIAKNFGFEMIIVI